MTDETKHAHPIEKYVKELAMLISALGNDAVNDEMLLSEDIAKLTMRELFYKKYQKLKWIKMMMNDASDACGVKMKHTDLILDVAERIRVKHFSGEKSSKNTIEDIIHNPHNPKHWMMKLERTRKVLLQKL